MTTIVIFSSSLFIATAMVSVKAFELKRGQRNILLKTISKFDSELEKLVFNLKFKALQLIQSVRYIILVQIKMICKNLLIKVEKRIVEEYKIRQNALMGHKNISNKGSVSFYLKKITEQKSYAGKGKIED